MNCVEEPLPDRCREVKVIHEGDVGWVEDVAQDGADAMVSRRCEESDE